MSEDYARAIDGNGFVPDEECHRRRCELCQKVRQGEEVVMFSRLITPSGKAWDICGKCVQVLWRKRQPKLEPIGMLCA